MERYPIILDVETDVVDNKVFADMGCLAPTEIKGYAFRSNGSGEVVWCSAFLPDTFRIAYPKDVILVMHNGIRFDVPVLKRLMAFNDEGVEVFDTLIASKVLWPDRKSHSLESYAKEFGIDKVGLDDLEKRCKSDVLLTEKLYHKCIEEIERRKMHPNVLKIEFQVARLVADQHRLGIRFDVPAAVELLHQIDKRMDEIAFEVSKAAELVPIPENKLRYPPKKQFTKAGTLSLLMEKYLNEECIHWAVIHTLGGPCESVSYLPKYMGPFDMHTCDLPMVEPVNKFHALDVSSISEVKTYLMNKGWKPTLWNFKEEDGKSVPSSPKLYDENKNLCPALEELAKEFPVINAIAEYYTLRNRRSVIQSKDGESGWLANTRVAREGKICPDADTVGAATGRMTHKIVANVPRVTSTLGREMRSLFKPPVGWVQVGWDATALEAVMEAHYSYNFDDGKYAEELLQGDIHTRNMEAVGLKDRDAAKKFKYAITYGARPKKLARTFNWSLKEAEEKYHTFWEANPTLAKLNKEVQKAAERGYLNAIDTRRIMVPMKHAALNRLLQSGGAIVMKYAMVLSERLIRRAGVSEDMAYGMIKYHDEEQWASEMEVADEVLARGIESVSLAAKYLKLKVPLKASGKIGLSWADTH